MRKNISKIKQKLKQNFNVRVHIDNRGRSRKSRRYAKKQTTHEQEPQIRTQTIFMTTPANNPPPIFQYTQAPNPIQEALTTQTKTDVPVSKPLANTIPIRTETPTFKKESEKLTPPLKLSTPSFLGNPLMTELTKKLQEREALKASTDGGENPLSIYQKTRIETPSVATILKDTDEDIPFAEAKLAGDKPLPNEGVKMFHCSVCNTDVRLSNKARHLKSDMHIKNANEQNLKES